LKYYKLASHFIQIYNHTLLFLKVIKMTEIQQTGENETRQIEEEKLFTRRQSLIFGIASCALSLIGCKKSGLSQQKKDFCADTDRSAEVLKISEKMLLPYGKIVHVTPERAQVYTVIAVKMIHQSGSFPQLNREVLVQYGNIIRIYEKLQSSGVKYFGGEGFNAGEVSYNEIPDSTYPFIRFEKLQKNEICSFGIDDTELLAKTHELLRQNRPLDALKLNPERTRAMLSRIRSHFEKFDIRTICITVGGDHLQNSEPELTGLMGAETLTDLLEGNGIRVVIVEPAGYKDLNNKISRLK
jgi:hypothetical protein